LYSMETVLSVKSLKLLLASSTITIRRSWLQGTIIRLHIQVIVLYFPHILCSFENICVFWSILEYSILLYGDSSKCRGIIIVRSILRNYHTDKLVTVNKLYVTYW
jgi:hypothetical protein